jgi:hypothetical protein
VFRLNLLSFLLFFLIPLVLSHSSCSLSFTRSMHYAPTSQFLCESLPKYLWLLARSICSSPFLTWRMLREWVKEMNESGLFRIDLIVGFSSSHFLVLMSLTSISCLRSRVMIHSQSSTFAPIPYDSSIYVRRVFFVVFYFAFRCRYFTFLFSLSSSPLWCSLQSKDTAQISITTTLLSRLRVC